MYYVIAQSHATPPLLPLLPLPQYHHQYFYHYSYDRDKGRAYSSHLGNGCVFGEHFKGAFDLLAPYKQMPYLINSNKNIFFQPSGQYIACDSHTQQRSRIGS